MRKSELVPQAVNAPPARLGLDREINNLRAGALRLGQAEGYLRIQAWR